jgi:hypothetical protein
MIVSSGMLRMYPGGWLNVVMTADAAVAILFGLGWSACADALARAAPQDRDRLEVLLLLAAAIQFVMITYDPRREVPTRMDLQAGREVVQSLRDIPGPVLVMSHPYLGELAGKPPTLHEMSASDLMGGRGPVAAKLLAEVGQAMADHRWAAVVTDDLPIPWFDSLLTRYYRPDHRLLADHGLFLPLAGTRKRPEIVYLPKPRPPL